MTGDTGPDETELAATLALLRAEGIGPAGARRLLDLFGAARKTLDAGAEALSAAGVPRPAVRALEAPDWDAVEADLAWRREPDRHLLHVSDPRYPARLAELSDAPPLLYVVGDPEVLAVPQLAVVGSRNPSEGGRRTAAELSGHLAGRGLVITSGLASGVDAAAHRGALEAGGLTVAVLGTGPDRVYPARNRELARAVADEGALVTELPPGTPARAGHFPRRNRIISGLALGVLVVEAAQRSGSLITARLAMEQGREVFAVPGSIHNPLARGCHALIRQGAKLVETGDHVLEELGPVIGDAALPASQGDTSGGPPAEGVAGRDPEYDRLLECMGYDPVSVDALVARSGLTPEQVSSMLLLLELQGEVASVPGGLYSRSA